MGLTNLSPRDTILLIIIANIVCYFLGYQIIVAPLINAYNTTNEEREVAQEENKNLKYEASQEEVYEDTILKLNNERRDEINSKFYQTVTAEKFHRWYTNLKKSAPLKLKTFEIRRDVTKTKDENGQEVEADFVDNKVTLNFTASYAQLVEFLQEIEADEKASKVTSLNIKPATEGGMSGEVAVSMEISFYSIKKNDGDDSSFSESNIDLGSPFPDPANRINQIRLGQ